MVLPSTLPTYEIPNACIACAKSKRKCGRQIPSCGRCAETGRPCVYPPSRRIAASSSRLLLPAAVRDSLSTSRGADGLRAEVADNTSSGATDPNLSLMLADDFMFDLAFPLTDGDFASSSSWSQTPSEPANKANWFLASETWGISRSTRSSAIVPVGIVTMKKYVAVLQSWFERWATTGSNPFIHRRLYSNTFPPCVQIAYASLASYIHRTPANTDAVLQIIEDRAADLLQENGAIMGIGDEDEWVEERSSEEEVDLFTQLARLHALMVYQIIGLHDGDIRSRHVAEGRMGINNIWATKLFQSAGRTLPDSRAAATHLVGYLGRPSTNSQDQWYLWILSESIRRTWLVAVSISSVYTALQKHWAACPGGVMYTNRSGLWNATSANEWEKQCLEKNVGFLQRFECSSLLDDAVPAEVDEFGMAMLDMTFDGDLLAKWRDRNAVYSR